MNITQQKEMINIEYYSSCQKKENYIEKLKKNPAIDWKLNKDEKEEIKLQWLRNSIKSSALLEQRFLESLQKYEQYSG